MNLDRLMPNSFSFREGKCHRMHDGLTPIKIGGYDIWLTGTRDINPTCLLDKDLIVSLIGTLPRCPTVGQYLPMYLLQMKDFGGVPDNWNNIISMLVDFIKSNRKVLAYCMGSHGRTGCFAASLIALMEPDTIDPIAAIRERHCPSSVETLAQAKAVFALLGKELPSKYAEEFRKRDVFQGGQHLLQEFFSTTQHGSGHHKPNQKQREGKYEESEYEEWCRKNGLQD